MKNIIKPKHRKLHLIIQFLQGSKVHFAAAVAASLISATPNALIPQIFRPSIDEVLGGNGRTHLSGHLWVLAMTIMAVVVASGIFTYISRANTTKAGESPAKNLRDALFIHVQKLSMKRHDRSQTGDIIQRCTSDVEVIRGFAVTQLLEVFRAAFLVIISFVMMFSMNVKLSCIVLLFVPVVIMYLTVFYRLTAKRSATADEAEGELSTAAQENATGVRAVWAFGREQFEMERSDKKNNVFARLWIRLGTLSDLYWEIRNLITGLQVVAAITFGVMEVVSGFISVDEFIAFAAYNSMLVWPVRGLGHILSDMSKAGVSLERVNYIIRSQEKVYGKRAEIYGKGNVGFGEENEASPKTYDIPLQYAFFEYEDGKDVLKNISFAIPEDRTFGVLGGTGSGKSTVVQLLSRLHELKDSRGSICTGGGEIRDIPIEKLQGNIGMVLQEPFSYSRMIQENISASVPDASMEEIRYAAQIARIDDAIMSLPDGHDTPTGGRGVTLSGGQKQRIAIARMLLQKAPITVFDNPLSAVDFQTDYHIRRALKEHIGEATVIPISHRVTSLMEADETMVLNQGQIEKCGTHGELVRKSGIYCEIYDIQMSRDDREKTEGWQIVAYEGQKYNDPLSFKIWMKLFPLLKPYREFFAITPGLNILLVGVDILVPLLRSYATDSFTIPDRMYGFGVLALVCSLVIVAQTICVYRSVHAATTIEMNVGKDLKRAQFQYLQILSFSYYNTTPVGYIHIRVMSDMLRTAGMAARGLVDMLWVLIYVVSAFVITFLLNVRLVCIITMIVPYIAPLTVYFQSRILKWNRKVRRTNSQITSVYNKGITGVKTPKSIAIEGDNEKRSFEKTSDMHQSVTHSAELNAVYIPAILFFSSMASVVVLAKGGYVVRENIIKLGALSVFISYAVVIFEPIQQLARLLADLVPCQANIEQVMDLLEQKSNVVDRKDVLEEHGDALSPNKEDWEKIREDIMFEDVSFMYPDGREYVLEYFNLHVPAGMNVMIVGETEAGKSTLVNLMGRFFEPVKGRILIGGVDHQERSQLWLHSQIGYVLQNLRLFSGTVRENIRYGRLDIPSEEIEEAARNVSADMVVGKMKKGYDSDVDEGGGLLSTGEKQLISFARVVLANPAIFVLDEAASLTDTQTEKLVQDVTDYLLKGYTSFVIAHRLSTIRQTDLILVVKDGKIIERGSRSELLGQKGYYYGLYFRQFEEKAAMKVFAGEQAGSRWP